MNRLTNSTESIIKAIATPIDVHKKQLIYLKLKSLEDIEEELGIELSVLFSALKNGAYYFDNHGQLIHDYVCLSDNYLSIGVRDKLSYSFMTFYDRQILSFEDYGKTWSLDKKDLTKEVLENEEKI